MTLPLIMHEAKSSPDVGLLVIIDDESDDGSSQWIRGMKISEYLGDDCQYSYIRKQVGNSTGQYQIALDECDRLNFQVKYLSNLCNDCLIPDGIIQRLVQHMENFENMFACGCSVNNGKVIKINDVETSFPYIAKSDLQDVTHIGIGLYRISVFREMGEVIPSLLKSEKRFFGFTQYQNRCRAKGYEIKIDKGIRIVELDRSNKFSQLIEHHKKGWTRNIIGKPQSIYNLTQS